MSFRPSETSRQRVTELPEKEKAQISEDERRELEQYMQLEHVMRLAKARARQLLNE